MIIRILSTVESLAMNAVPLLTVCVAFLAYGLLSQRLRRTPLSGPMLFTAFGLAAGPAFLNLVPLAITAEALHLLAEVTLIIVLFSDAAEIDFKQLRRDHDLPMRMLLLGLPIMVLLGTLAGWAMFPRLGILGAALLAALLAPTDAALGQAVVTEKAIPVRIRQTLNVESGLNDGLALPLVLIFAMLLASAGEDSRGTAEWTRFILLQLLLGPLSGLAVGFVGGKLVGYCYRVGWMSEIAEGMIALSLAFGAFGLAESVQGNGFIAAFVAGFTFSNTQQHRCKFLYEFAESEGKLLVLLTFLAFGSALLPLLPAGFTFAGVLYALASLTIIRMLAIAASLSGTGLRAPTVAFLGWFGPRGLASILFLILILQESHLEHEDLIRSTVILTVLASIVFHGASANILSRKYADYVRGVPEPVEMQPVPKEPFSSNRNGSP